MYNYDGTDGTGNSGGYLMTHSEFVMNNLMDWVKVHGNGKFIDGETTPLLSMENYTIEEDYGIQQVYDEIKEFVDLLLHIKDDRYQRMTNVLEVGLGYFGSTHFLWRQLFDKTITIEMRHERIREFGKNSREYYGKWVLSDKKSAFFVGMSSNPIVVKRVYNYIQKIGWLDVLFIDGDHSYEGVLTDWLLYSPLVRKRGIVAFHDCLLSEIEGGAAGFVNDLQEGKVDGVHKEIHRIVHSKYAGIAYYFKE
jgi:hypothetical protein